MLDYIIIALDKVARRSYEKRGEKPPFHSKDWQGGTEGQLAKIHSVMSVPKEEIITSNADKWPWPVVWSFLIYDAVDKSEYYCVLGYASMVQLPSFSADKTKPVIEASQTPTVRKFLEGGNVVSVCRFEQCTEAVLEVAPMHPAAKQKDATDKETNITEVGGKRPSQKAPAIT
jgi:hypothetical protein